MNLTTKQKECLEMMERSSFVYLTTIDLNGFPATRAMLNLRNKEQYPRLVVLCSEEENPLTVYMTTNTSSEKIKEIAENGKACLYFCEAGSFHGILLQGTIEHVIDKEFRKSVWQKGWEIYYPKGDEDYSAFITTPAISAEPRYYYNLAGREEEKNNAKFGELSGSNRLILFAKYQWQIRGISGFCPLRHSSSLGFAEGI